MPKIVTHEHVRPVPSAAAALPRCIGCHSPLGQPHTEACSARVRLQAQGFFDDNAPLVIDRLPSPDTTRSRLGMLENLADAQAKRISALEKLLAAQTILEGLLRDFLETIPE